MIRALLLTFSLALLPISSVQAMDVVTLGGGTSITLTDNADTGQQDLMADGTAILSAPAIIPDLVIFDETISAAGLVIYAATEDETCAPSPYVVSLQFGVPWAEGPIGIPCAPYLATSRLGTVAFLSAPDLGQNGDAVLFDLTQGIVPLGPIGFAPIPNRGWDALDAEVGGYSDLSGLDLYMAEPVHSALVDLWDEDLFIFARHLSSRTVPLIEGNFLFQSGCLAEQCAFTLGLLAVDAANEEVYSAFFNEGAPDVRPPLESWSEPARALFERWREGEFR